MGKKVFIAEKPSVANEFAKALKLNTKKHDGYLESDEAIVTWCVGHLVRLSYPEVYNEALKKWSLDTIPFMPKEYKYEVIDGVKKQFNIVKGLLTREDVDTIYICTDSGREGEYIYRLVDQEANVGADKQRKRVWIDSQTEEEILRGIKEAKDWKEYDKLSDSAYLRAKEDYLMGINFSRVLSLKYGNSIANFLNEKYAVVSVGRVMTCVLGMIVKREREIREFVKTPFYRIIAKCGSEDGFEMEWKVNENSFYNGLPVLYKDNGFLEEAEAKRFIEALKKNDPLEMTVTEISKKSEKKNPPLLYNLAEAQNDCSKIFKISPNDTLKVIQELYEKKLVTYPRTDARVLSTAVAKEITKNLKGLTNHSTMGKYAAGILESGAYKGLEKTKYVNDKQITDHYAIIPTGVNPNGLVAGSLQAGVYNLIVKRFLSIFYPAAVYKKINISGTVPCDRSLLKQGETPGNMSSEMFQTSVKVLESPGYLEIAGMPNDEKQGGQEMFSLLNGIRKNDKIGIVDIFEKMGETSPPKRYNSGSLILAMENAGQLIEDEELREQIKGSGIGTSATRAEIIDKLIRNKYISLNKKTQIISPKLMGEMIYDVVSASINQLLNPELTASWEKGLTMVAQGEISADEYMQKLEGFVERRTNYVKGVNNQYKLRAYYQKAAVNYKR